MNADYSVNNQFERLEVTINQYNRENNKRLTKSNINISKSGSSMISYRATGYFEYNNADCFSSDSYSNADIDDCINGYLTSYTGYVQGGDNWFTVTPIHDGYEVEHNLLEKGISVDKYCDYTVLIHPSVSFDYTTADHQDAEPAPEPKWIWDHKKDNSAFIEQQIETLGTWSTITNVTTSFSYMRGGSMKASWEYGFDYGGVSFSQVSEFNQAAYNTYVGLANNKGSGNSTSTSMISNISVGGNWFKMTVTTNCKPGFASVFSGGGSWSFSLDLSPGSDGIKSFTPRSVDYINSTSVMSFVSAEVTGGSMGRGSVKDYIFGEGDAGSFEGGNRSVSARGTVTVSSDLPAGFSFKVNLSVSVTCKNSADTVTRTKSGMTTTVTVSSGGSASFSVSGQYWETQSFGCLASLGTFVSGSASDSWGGRA